MSHHPQRANAEAREAARRPTGEFGTQPRHEASLGAGGVDLATDPWSHKPGEQAPLEDTAANLRTAAEDAVSAAYAAGQRDALLRAADLIHEAPGPAAALSGYLLRHPDGAYTIALDERNGFDMADRVLAAASTVLRQHAGQGAEAAASRSTGTARPSLADQVADGCAPCNSTGLLSDRAGRTLGPCQECGGTGSSDVCITCAGHGYEREVGPAAGGGALYSGECAGCGGVGTQKRTGTAVACPWCAGRCSATGASAGMPDPQCDLCRGGGRVRSTPAGQAEVQVPGHGRFARVTVGAEPGEHHVGTPYALRLEASRPLSDDDISRAAQLLGYTYRATVAGEPLGWPHRDSPTSFVVAADTTKTRRDDLGVALDDLTDTLADTLDQGSPMRTTNRAGAYTQGTRLIEGFDDPDLRFDLYADDTAPA